MKWILEQECVSEAKKGSPKIILEVAFRYGLIDDQKMWIRLLKLRNDESHLYNERCEIEVCEEMKSIIPVFEKLKETIIERGYFGNGR